MEYRQLAMSFLVDNPQEYQFMFTSELDRTSYIERMSKSGTWGGEMELAILSKLLSIKFEVYLSDGHILNVDNTKAYTYDDDGNELGVNLPDSEITTVKLSYHNREHYNYLQPK
jgi:hypothetical protein